ncbi:MAG: dihydrodipicolinate synthase family protein [Gordonia sp. (in: high G+C Gram-positive bacteria)]|uniref:dihydrodipicolinate synthase family protein n=1 Tax=Gordonia sp. (in: high G+C Gram-positive bacteria) TaxID=84139 RepID=UPI0039E3D95B
MTQQPWRGIHVATALPFNDDLSIDYDAWAEEVTWLAENGMDGVTPNGSLGEYQTLTDEERYKVVSIAVDAAPEGFRVMAGCGAYGALESVRAAEQAAEAGAQSIMLLPPNTYRADRAAVIDHFRRVAEVGLPIVGYNNPLDTKVDMKPDLLAELHGRGYIKGVKEFTGDVRRIYEIKELAPELDILIGTDDVLLELGVAGAVGWVSGYTNAFPNACRRLYDLATSGDVADIEAALPLYRDLHPLLRWDSKTEFVQAIKLSMDIVGRKGGICRPPRTALPADIAAQVTEATEHAVSAGYN